MGSWHRVSCGCRENVEQLLELALFLQTQLALLCHAPTFCLAGRGSGGIFMTFREISMIAVFGVQCACVYGEIGAFGNTRLVERP